VFKIRYLPLFFILLTGFIWLPNGINSLLIEEVRSDLQPSMSNRMTPSYEIHSTISILNDTDFYIKSQAENWDGDGSSDTPYIIEGYNITADVTCISMYDISVYFIIRDCYLSSGFDMGMRGIAFDNVTNGRVEQCVIESSFIGISLYESPGNFITNCNVNYGSEAGIQLSNSDYVTITDCYVFHSGDGFNIGSSDFVTIQTCTVWDSYARGIYVSNCENTMVDGCDVYDNGEYSTSGVEFRNSSNSSVKNNNIFDNYHTGLYLYNAFLYNITGNNVYNNSETGIKMDSSCNMINITENAVYENGWWDSILLSPGGILSGVMINLTIHKNTIFNNSQNGILMNGTYKPIVTENEIYDNPQCGILADHVDNAHVEMNHIYGNGWNSSMPIDNGIYATFSNEWGVFGNEIVDNSHSGMIFYDSYGHLIENNFVNWSVGYGIALVWTTDTVITGNHLIGHLSNCIRLTQSHRSNITNNIIQGGNSSIRILWSENVLISYNIIWDALTYGIWLDTTDNSTVFYNDIGWNGIANAIDDQGSGNVWDDGDSVGNWWNNWQVGSGPYNITDLSNVLQNQDNHPNRSIEILSAPTPIAYEISSTGNTMEFAAQALNPLVYEVYANGTLIDEGDWIGGLIVADVDGLGAGYSVMEFRAIHISGHYRSAYSSATVTDLTPPEWIIGPHDELLRPYQSLSQQLEAFDHSSLIWYVNDTTNFAISATGLLTNNTILEMGDYGLRVCVEDVYGNLQDWEVRIRVYPSTTTATSTTPTTITSISSTTQWSTESSSTPSPSTSTTPGDLTLIIIIIGAGGVIVVIVIIVIFSKKR